MHDFEAAPLTFNYSGVEGINNNNVGDFFAFDSTSNASLSVTYTAD